MKYMHLIWAALFRRKTRTILTLVSIIAAFLLFGMLNAVRTAFESTAQSAAGASRLVTSSRYSIIQPLPKALQNRIAAVDGVAKVGFANWFGGAYQDPKNMVFSYAISPEYLDLYPEIKLSDAARKKFDQTRTGAVVGKALAKRYGWKVGDKIPMLSTIFPQKDGSKAWPMDIVGIFDISDDAQNGTDQALFFHWKYFDEANAYGQGTVGWYIEKLSDSSRADQIAQKIDAISANSTHETKSQTEKAFQASFAKQIGNIGLIVSAIMGAVFFTLLLLVGNTMMQAVRERTSELAVLKTIGFTNTSVLMMVLAESMLLLLLGGVIGLGLAAILGPAVTSGSGGMVNLPSVGWQTWSLGIAFMLLIGLLIGALPALRGMRLNIVDALRVGQ